MNINPPFRAHRPRITPLAGAVLAGALTCTFAAAATAPAAAAGGWVAVARGYPATTAGPADQIGGVGLGATQQAAMIAALNNCSAKGGGHCGYYGSTDNACIALAVGGTKDWTTGTGAFISLAQRLALEQNPGGRILASGCSNAGGIVGNPGPVVASPR